MAHSSLSRREMLAAAAALATFSALPLHASSPERPSMTIAVFIRYQIDPFQLDAFRAYASAWGPIIPRLGGHLIGYFLPKEGTNDIAWGLIGFESLAAYEVYRGRLKRDPEAMANFTGAQKLKCILREERTFVELVPGTFDRPPAMPA